MPGFMLVPLIVAMYLLKLNEWLMSSLALELFWESHISIQIMAMSNLGEALMTQGLDAKVMFSNILLFFKKLMMSLLVRARLLDWI